ncbi:hypothetical protein GCM10023153_13420 [Ornithinibacter aureus]|uniref:Uncharacterized protein n=1 Tax=Ornithinibacter aureus TaxID=622664 RepID=A0ABP8JMV9_9MICO
MTIATALLVATPVTASTGEDVTVASGTVQSGSGVPVQARVIAYAWPSNAAVAATPEGGGLQLFPVGSVLTSAAGSYTLNLAPEDLEMFTDAFGNVNLEIVSVTADGRSAATSTSLSTDSGVEGAPLTMAEATPDLTVITQSAPKGTDADLLADFVDMGQSPTQAAASAFALQTPACGSIYKGSLGSRTVWVGGTYSTTSGVTGDLVYVRGADSALGVGVSVTGKYGSFKASGTASVSTSDTINFPSSTGRRHYYTNFEYGKYLVGCTGSMKYIARPRSYIGGSSVWTPSTVPTANYCTSYVNGTTVTKNRTTAYQNTAGVDISAAIGLDLSSRTGYQTDAAVTYKFTATRRLCGVTGYPGGTPSRLVAKL